MASGGVTFEQWRGAVQDLGEYLREVGEFRDVADEP
jgi:hypothetical protein